MKNNEKKGKVEHVLLYRFLNDENSSYVFWEENMYLTACTWEMNFELW